MEKQKYKTKAKSTRKGQSVKENVSVCAREKEKKDHKSHLNGRHALLSLVGLLYRFTAIRLYRPQVKREAHRFVFISINNIKFIAKLAAAAAEKG